LKTKRQSDVRIQKNYLRPIGSVVFTIFVILLSPVEVLPFTCCFTNITTIPMEKFTTMPVKKEKKSFSTIYYIKNLTEKDSSKYKKLIHEKLDTTLQIETISENSFDDNCFYGLYFFFVIMVAT